MSGRLVTIATFNDSVAASLAKNFLESEDIAAILLDESTAATDWSLWARSAASNCKCRLYFWPL